MCPQIYTEVKKFGKAYNIHVVCAYGGGNMYEQQKACEQGPEVIVATPVSSILAPLVMVILLSYL